MSPVVMIKAETWAGSNLLQIILYIQHFSEIAKGNEHIRAAPVRMRSLPCWRGATYDRLVN